MCMKIDMFGQTEVVKSSINPTISMFDWQGAIKNKAVINQQVDFCEVENGIMTYRSGASSRSDALGYIEAQSPIGINVMDASSHVRDLFAAYASSGGKCFIDSGAFRTFMARLKKPTTPVIDFNAVLERYQEIVSACLHPENILLVAPDAVGDQEGSYTLLCQHKALILKLHSMGAKVMVPMQKGPLELTAHYQRCKGLLNFDFVVGLPSNAEAISRAEVLTFIKDIKPGQAHFLGCSERALIHEAQFISQSTQFSCDATRIRQQLGKGRLLTEMENQLSDDVAQNALHGVSHADVGHFSHWDETEILGDLEGFLASLSDAMMKEFAKSMSTTVKRIVNAIDNNALWEHLDDVNHGYGCHVVSQFIWHKCHQSVRKAVRVHAVKTLAQANII